MKNQLLKLGFSFVGFYENDPDFRKVCYEIDIQTYRIPQVKEYVDAAHHQMSEVINKMLQKGVALGLFDADTIDVKVQYLLTMIMGLDKAILFEHEICAKEVWQYTIDHLFLKENT